AMLASYFFSRTIVPTLVMYFFLAERKRAAAHVAAERKPGLFRRFHLAFEDSFERLRDRYVNSLEGGLHYRLVGGGMFPGLCAGSMALIPVPGTDLFPTVDAGQIRLHVRAPIGTRVEETAALCDHVEDSLRRHIGTELSGITDTIGFPNSGINT